MTVSRRSFLLAGAAALVVAPIAEAHPLYALEWTWDKSGGRIIRTVNMRFENGVYICDLSVGEKVWPVPDADAYVSLA